MATNIFVNLPVNDLKKSVEFFTKVGYTFNPQFTDETSTCMIISDTIYAMLLTHDKFKLFSKKEIVDAKKNVEVLIALSEESKEKVNELVDKAVAAGGKEGESQDQGFMFTRTYDDLDGHTWEVFWMDPSAIQG